MKFLDWYLKIGVGSALVGASMEFFMIKTGFCSEGSAVWVPAPGQDISSLQVSSLYNLTPNGYLAFPPTQNIHGAFAGTYHQPGQTIASPSTLLQQS